MKTALMIIAMAMILSGIVYAVWYYITTNKVTESEDTIAPSASEAKELQGGALEFTFLAGQWYMCIRDYYEFQKGTVYQCKFNGSITIEADGQKRSYAPTHPALYFRPAKEDEIPVKPEPEPDTAPKPQPEPTPDPIYDETFEEYLNAYKEYAQIGRDSQTYLYLKALYDEAYCQFTGTESLNGIPPLVAADNFPMLYAEGNDGSITQAFSTLVGYLFALQLASLKPIQRTAILKTGYELGGYNRYSSVYGYNFELDPNNMRIVAGAVYSAMRGVRRPDENAMRDEIGGEVYGRTLELLASGKRDEVSPYGFFIDFREYMPTAPGPYAPGYNTRPDHVYPHQAKDDYKNLQADRDIHEDIVEAYNLNNNLLRQAVVQAIADKEADRKHLFGKNRTTEHYHFHPVFGEDTIGIELDDSGDLAEFASLAFSASSAARGILQSATVDPRQYGRLRPGCSWTQEAKKNSDTDDRRNILTNFEIEDGDGSPTGYYDQNGNWVYMNGVQSPADFEEQQKSLLYANSYPSGHSAGIMGVAMVLMELMPDRADRILRAANQYAVNRTIARYHWTSDTINGRVLGIAQNAVAHASWEYDDLLDKARKNLGL